jgi:hypothetical protein
VWDKHTAYYENSSITDVKSFITFGQAFGDELFSDLASTGKNKVMKTKMFFKWPTGEQGSVF